MIGSKTLLKMKKTLSIFAIAMGLMACTQEELPQQQEQNQPSLEKSQTMTITASIAESNLTKTALIGNDTNGYDVVWSYGDEITVGGYGGNLYGLYEGEGKTSATFFLKGNNNLSDGEYDSFYRMYDKTLPINQKYYPDNTIKSSPMHAKVTISGGKPEPAQFHNLCGLLRLKLKEKEVKDYIEVKQIKISADQAMAGQFDIVDYAAVMKSESVYNYITLNCSNEGDNVPLTTDGVDFYIALPAGTYSNVVFEVTDKDGSVCTKRLKTGNTITIERSKITPASFTVKGEDFIPCNLKAVDMGLSVLWANMNLGAVSPAQTGDYFAWGETSTKNVLFYRQDYYFDKEYTEYSASGKTVLDPENDAAHVTWGGDWRMPTIDELAELFDESKTVWSYVNNYGEEINGVHCSSGMKITSKLTNNSIFLKSTGYYNGTELKYDDSEGLYWSSTISADDSAHRLKFSYPYNSTDGYHERHDVTSSSFRFYGLPIRPVCKK